MKTDTLYIHTIGCQMNVYDSDRIAGLLEPMHFTMTDSPDSADLVVVNTCAIRAKAEQKVFSYLGRLAKLKARKPDLMIAVGGCVAQQEGKKILDRIPAVDVVFGTRAIERLPGHIASIKRKRKRIVDLGMQPIGGEPERVTPWAAADPRVSRFVTIMRGCDNFCSYCVVPYVRGRESSRHPEHIVEEIRGLVKAGVREVTLLGQNVNSYGIKEGICSFPELLEKVDGIDGLLRIRFTTSHPKDLSDGLIEAFGSLNKLCRHIHLPVQSGADSVLRRMNRRYTREEYLRKVERLRRRYPDIAVTSDFIVGFPGETDADFQATLGLIREVDFDGLFVFMYSDRPSAPASRFPEKVPEKVKNERLQILLELQEAINADRNRRLIGTVQAVLAEGPAKRKPPGTLSSQDPNPQWSGRTSGNKIVSFPAGFESCLGCEAHPGEMMNIRIESAFSHSLWGKPVAMKPRSVALKGECHAA